MALTINTNTSSLMAQQNLTATNQKLAQTIERLSTGQRINTAKDDAAGLAIAQNMEAETRGLKQGARNANDGISLIQTAEGGLDQTLNILQRMHELAIEASSGTYDTTDLTNIDTEFQSLMTEVDRIAQTVNFNSINLMNSASTIKIQVGTQSTANDVININLIDATASGLSLSGDTTTHTNAQTAIGVLDTAISSITTALASLGASHGKLDAAVSENSDRAINLESAMSQIQDTDFAAESAELAKLQILQQAGAAMLAQANSSGQIALKLIQ